MAINVDTVYQRVLAILNKEQRGYLDPQKFNLYANHIQLEKLESYIYDLDYFLSVPGNSTQVADMVEVTREKLSKFETEVTTPTFSSPHFLLPSDCYRIDSVIYNGVECNPISRKEYLYISQSPIGKPSDAFPVYIKDDTGIKVYGTNIFTNVSPSADPISINYIRRPANVVWGYTSVLGAAQYNAATSTDFELDASEETDVVIGILKLAGVEVKDLSTYEVASKEEITEKQIERS